MQSEYAKGLGFNAVHQESNLIAGDILIRATASGDNVVVPLVGSWRQNVIDRLTLLKNAGYRVHLILAGLPIDKAANRAIV
jgi:hypothetical protein